MKLSEYDCLPIEEAPVKKFSHHFKDGDKIVVRDQLHRHGLQSGEIEAMLHNGKVHVRLDSGHELTCQQSELTPADFPGEEHSDQDGEVAAMASAYLRDGLTKAIQDGEVSDADFAVLQQAALKYRRGEFASDPYSGVDVVQKRNFSFDVFTLMARKYTGAGNTLAKRARPRTDLAVGKKVRGMGGKIGVITKLTDYYALVDYDGSVSTELVHAVQLA